MARGRSDMFHRGSAPSVVLRSNAAWRCYLVRQLLLCMLTILSIASITLCALTSCSSSVEVGAGSGETAAVSEDDAAVTTQRNARAGGALDEMPALPEGQSIAEASRAATLDDLPEGALADVERAEEIIDAGAEVVDIRNRYDYAAAHIKGARNMAAGKSLEIQCEKLPRDTMVLLVGGNEGREAESWQILAYCGFPASSVYVLNGGMEAWEHAGLPTVTTPVKGC